MSKVHNFSAGPAILPQEVFEKSIEAIKNFRGTGLSLLEVSHRGKEFTEVMANAQTLVKDLMQLGNDYSVLFLQGGASTQFLMIAMNLLENKAAYLNTGTWSKKAIKEAAMFGEVDIVASSEDSGFNYIPKDYKVDSSNDFFHCTSNNTIFGTQMHSFPNVPCVNVCDMSSDIFSRKMDFKAFDLIYAGAQKNMGPAGTVLVVIKNEILGKVSRILPTMMNYQTHIDKGSMFNTPPVFPVFCSMLNLEWITQNGGLDAMEKRNKEKAEALYSEIDNNSLFEGIANKEDRSFMNVTFKLNETELEDSFLKACAEANISGIKGHRSVGGFRASIYNAMDLNGVSALTSVMNSFN